MEVLVRVFQFAVLLFSTTTAAQSPAHFRVRIVPNAIQSDGTPMQIIASGPPQATASLFVLQDCNRDGQPDPDGTAKCRSPLLTWTKQLETTGELDDKLDFSKHPELPRNVALWLSICAGPTARRNCSDALFSIGSDDCGIFKAVLHALSSGHCDPKLNLALANRRGASPDRASLFEVQVIEPTEQPGSPAPVANTGGATGVAWLNPATLIVTLGKLAPGKTPGVYLMKEDGSVVKQVWKADTTGTPNAPLGLPGGRVAFAITRAAPDKALTVSLAIWDRQRVREIALDRPVRALLSHEAGGTRLLASTFSPAGSSFVLIDTRSGRVTDLGHSDVLLMRLQRSPIGELVAIDYEDVSTDRGWEIALVDSEGKGVAELSTGPGDSWLPAWRPDGKKLAFLAEQGR